MVRICKDVPEPRGLAEHPEGGRYKRVFCADSEVVRADGERRAAVSQIYFELRAGERSSMHRVENAEIWNLYQGEGVYLYLWDGSASEVVRVELSERMNVFCYLVPAGVWQAAEPLGERALVGCTVAPAFEFDDFTLLRDAVTERELFLQSNPESRRLV